MLLGKGANPHSVDVNGQKPVHLAGKNEIRVCIMRAMDAHTNCLIASVCMYVCVCVCVCVYVCTYEVLNCFDMYVCMCVCMCVCACMCMHI